MVCIRLWIQPHSVETLAKFCSPHSLDALEYFGSLIQISRRDALDDLVLI